MDKSRRSGGATQTEKPGKVQQASELGARRSEVGVVWSAKTHATIDEFALSSASRNIFSANFSKFRDEPRALAVSLGVLAYFGVQPWVVPPAPENFAPCSMQRLQVTP